MLLPNDCIITVIFSDVKGYTLQKNLTHIANGTNLFTIRLPELRKNTRRRDPVNVTGRVEHCHSPVISQCIKDARRAALSGSSVGAAAWTP